MARLDGTPLFSRGIRKPARRRRGGSLRPYSAAGNPRGRGELKFIVGEAGIVQARGLAGARTAPSVLGQRCRRRHRRGTQVRSAAPAGRSRPRRGCRFLAWDRWRALQGGNSG